jgi:hypothetical protein
MIDSEGIYKKANSLVSSTEQETGFDFESIWH